MQLKYAIFAVFCIGLVNGDGGVVGGFAEADDDDRKYLSPLLHEALLQLNGQEDGAKLHLVRILSAHVQVVSGKLYKIRAELENEEKESKKCNISLWHKPWDKNFGQTKFNCDDDTKYKVIKNNRRKRTVGGIVGGPSNVDDEEIVEQLRQNITESFTQLQSEGSKPLQLKEVLGAQKQVVAGILYTVRTVVDSGDGPQKCDIEVWLKPWIDFRQVSVKCENGEKFQAIRDNRPKRASLLRPLIPDDEQQNGDLDADSPQSHFNRFKQNFGRVYRDDEEEAMRFRVFENNLFLIRQLNKFEQGTAAYGVTDFADLTQDEYFQRTGLLKRDFDDDELNNEIQNPLAEIPDINLPKSHDWRDHGAVTPVKNQGNCGSCWAFSVTGNVEGLNAIKSGELKSLSEQELVDCDDLDAGCNGGLPDNAVKFIEKEGGLELETDYPYTAHRSKCHFNESLSRVRVSGVIDFKAGDEDAMAKWLTVNGPISIGINANAMQFYRGGISHPWKALCRPSSLDHGVLIVGFGVAEYPAFNKTMPYWIIKNSWGPKWGEQGYYRVHRGDNTCGVSSMASSAVLAKSTNY